MYVSALRASGYRNLNGTFGLCQPLAVVVGENNSGKSNLIDALRTVLEPEAGPRARHWLREEDFTHDGHRNRLRDDLELEVQLRGLSPDEQERLVTCLAPMVAPDAAKIRLRAKLHSDGRLTTQWFGGDSQHPDVERHAREAVRFVYLHALRDAMADLRPGRDNKLIALVADMLAAARHRTSREFPIVTVVSDPVNPHASWASSASDQVFATSEVAAEQISRFGRSDVHVVDFPVEPAFTGPQRLPREARRSLIASTPRRSPYSSWAEVAVPERSLLTPAQLPSIGRTRNW